MKNPRTWSDDELCRYCIPKNWEGRLETIGCVTAPLVSALVLFLWYLPSRKDADVLEGAAIWVVGTLLLLGCLHGVVDWRCRRQKAELTWRYGQREFSVHRRNARRELRTKTAGKIYLFQGRDIEGKQYAFVKITLQETEPASGRLTVRIAPDFQTAKFRAVFGRLVSQERELTQEEVAVLLAASTGTARSGPHRAPKVEKGFACSVATLERSKGSMASCDLLDAAGLEADTSTLQLALRLLNLAETVTDHPLVSHWDIPDDEREMLSLELSVDAASRLFQRQDAPDWIILFQGAALPHGGQHLLRVVLSADDPNRGRLWALTHTYKRSDQRDPRSDRKSHDKELSVEETQPLLDGLHSIAPRADLKLPRFPVFDGFPCNLVVLRRAPSEVTRAECNLAGLTETQAEEPLVKLMLMLLGLRRDAGAEAAHFGACGPTGNIQIGEI